METFLSFMPYFCVGYGAFYVGKHWALWQFSQNLSKDPDRMIEILNQIKNINTQVDEHDMPEDAIPLEIERVNGYVYAYSKTTGEFLSQAHDIEQAIRIASQRFPGKTFWHPDFKKDSQTA
jgi:hypothetical protein